MRCSHGARLGPLFLLAFAAAVVPASAYDDEQGSRLEEHGPAQPGRTLLASLPRGWELREALQKLDPMMYDLAAGPERAFLPDMHNPCWHAGKAAADRDKEDGLGDSEGAGVRCLPYAMVLGGFQSGAASLFTALYKHPMVVKTDVARWHFWAEQDKNFGAYLDGMRGAVQKLSRWNRAVEAAGRTAGDLAAGGGGAGAMGLPDEDGEGGGGGAAAGGAGGGGGNGPGSIAWLAGQHKILLDGSSSTFAFYWSPGMRTHRAFLSSMTACWTGCHNEHKKEGDERNACLEGCYGPAREADRKVSKSIGIPYSHMSLPLVLSAVYGRRPPRMVVLLRNPIDRLYSAFWYYDHYRTKYGASTDGFRAYVNEQLGAVKDCIARQPAGNADSCILHFESYSLKEEKIFFHADQIMRSVYSVYMEVWLDYFDRKDFLVLRSEDYFADPWATFNRVLKFMDLDPEAANHHKFLEAVERAEKDGKPLTKIPPADDKVMQDIKRTLYADIEGNYSRNRAAALSARGQQGAQAAAKAAAAHGVETGSAAHATGRRGEERPPMPEDVRKVLREFFAPYNKRLAELLKDSSFIDGWD